MNTLHSERPMLLKKPTQGFSTVELLVTIFVAVIFLFAGYTLYSTIVLRSADSRHKAQADNIAFDYIHRYESTTSIPCAASTPLNAVAVTTGAAVGLAQPTVTVAITCPNSSVTSISLVTVTVNYLEKGVQKNVYYEVYGPTQ